MLLLSSSECGKRVKVVCLWVRRERVSFRFQVDDSLSVALKDAAHIPSRGERRRKFVDSSLDLEGLG